MAVRWIALAALLLTLQAAAETRQAQTCGNGRTHQQSYCPAVLSSPTGTQTGATTGTVGATSDQTDGTRYACAASSATPLTCPQIQACSGGTAVAGSSAAETGSNSIALTGLTTDAAHYGQSCNESPEDWDSNVVVSSSFTPTAPGSGLYDLTGIPTRFETVEFADPPVTTSSATVNNQTELNANLVSGRQITVNAGSYSALTINSSLSDIDLIVSNSANFSGVLSIAGTRIRITGGNYQWSGAGYGSMIGGQAGHITLDNVVIEQGMDSQAFGADIPDHVTILNSTIRSPDTGYAMFLFNLRHWIVANTSISNTATAYAGIRMIACQNMIFIDGEIHSSSNRTLRIHDDGTGFPTDLLLFYNMQMSHTTQGVLWITPTFGSGDGLTRIELRNSRLYFPSATGHGGVAQMDGDIGVSIDDVIVRDNTIYSPETTMGGSGVTNYTSSPNTYNSYTSPPTFTGGASR